MSNDDQIKTTAESIWKDSTAASLVESDQLRAAKIWSFAEMRFTALAETVAQNSDAYKKIIDLQNAAHGRQMQNLEAAMCGMSEAVMFPS